MKVKDMVKAFVRCGRDTRYFEVPSNWKILTFAEFRDHPPKEELGKIIRKSLRNPIGAPALKDCISRSDRVTVLIEDQTRSSPKEIILRVLLEELHKAGVPRSNISVVVALGTHRGLPQEELDAVYGKDIVKRYFFTNHDCHAPDLVPVARFKTGTSIKINRRVHEATFKIGIGSIFPHPMNGFGGGGKILFPGVANFDAILEHHLKRSFRHGSGLGKLRGNPFYQEVCSLARAAGLDFIVNSVLDHNDRLYNLVCGDPLEAHLAGIDLSKQIITMNFQKRADVTVISSFPYTEGTQIMKPLAPASEITRAGGVIILVANCTVPLRDAYIEACEKFRMKHAGHLKEAVFGFFDNNRRIMEDGAPELNMSMAQALLAQDEFRVILVSEEIPQETTERLGFLYAQDLDRAFDLSATFCPKPEVHIVPSGGVILPMLETGLAS
ncbi:MAG: nickel-dependent lactate racemase [Deltaproteobacteria bacterium]|nr:nickel-dependent lactate racemase [Deltaproteobacteria bacterium]